MSVEELQVDNDRTLARRLALCAALALAVFLFNAFTEGPIVIEDGTSYLANAAALAGHPNDMASSYHAGYSILISPAFWFADGPEEVWRGVLVINAGLFFLTVFLMIRLADLLAPAASEARRLGAVLVVSLYPMWVITVGYSLAHNAFVPLYLLLVLLLFRALATSSLLSWLLLGVFSGFLYWVHPTALPVLVAVAVTGLLQSYLDRRASLAFAVLLGIAGCALFYTQLFMPWLHEARMTVGPKGALLHYPDPVRLLGRLFSLDRFKVIAGNLGGHLMYLIIGTGGVIALGVAAGVRRVASAFTAGAPDDRRHSGTPAVFLLLSFLGVLALSLIFFSGTGENKRIDHWMYGRYVEGVLAPLLLLGLLEDTRKAILWSIPVLLVSALLCVIFVDPVPTMIQPVHFSAFWPLSVFESYRFAGWGLVGCALLFLLAIAPRWVASSLVGALFIGSSFLHRGYHVDYVEESQDRREGLIFLREHFPSGSCIAFDPEHSEDPGRSRYLHEGSFLFYDYIWVVLTSQDWQRVCPGPLVSFDDALLEDPDLQVLRRLRPDHPYIFVRKSQLEALRGKP